MEEPKVRPSRPRGRAALLAKLEGFKKKLDKEVEEGVVLAATREREFFTKVATSSASNPCLGTCYQKYCDCINKPGADKAACEATLQTCIANCPRSAT